MKFITCVALAAFALQASQVHAASNAFDLVCDGKGGQQYLFRFDVTEKKWCMGECQSVWTIDQLADSRITVSVRNKDDSDHWTISFDRYTSKFWIVRRGYGSDPKEWGECKAIPFSGFPQKKF